MKIDKESKTITIDKPEEAGWLIGQWVIIGDCSGILCKIKTKASPFVFVIKSHYMSYESEIQVPFPKLSELKDSDVVRVSYTVFPSIVYGFDDFKAKEHYHTQIKPTGLELCVGRGLWVPVDMEEG